MTVDETVIKINDENSFVNITEYITEEEKESIISDIKLDNFQSWLEIQGPKDSNSIDEYLYNQPQYVRENGGIVTFKSSSIEMAPESIKEIIFNGNTEQNEPEKFQVLISVVIQVNSITMQSISVRFN